MEKEAGSELERFVKLHAQHDGTTELFYKLEKAAGLEKVFQHIEELDSLFGFNKRDFREEVIITDRWADFTAGKTESLETLMKKLELTREADGQKIKTLIRRAHFSLKDLLLSGLTTAFKWTILRSRKGIERVEPNPTWDDIRIGDLETRNKLAAAASKVAAIMEFEKHGNLKVLLAIDEASNLIDPYRQTTPDSILSRVSVFTDTTSRIANFNPALDRDPCSRFHSRGVGLFAPIYKISAFDAFVSQEKPSSWNDLLSAERLFNYGCPFYGCISRVN
ncbi:hypothetical protein PSTT_10605 [Puccinia striiformis]|uniref:Uncharacterized protein n=1 Tax=Puccinia striiformis TaxID=27350 RepID=A0A2S4V3X5_9BASI|nr:hypothetical protein PSTT_10605 [Puccinia striiformis]